MLKNMVTCVTAKLLKLTENNLIEILGYNALSYKYYKEFLGLFIIL